MFADEVAEVGGELNPSLGFDGGLPLLTYPASPVTGVEEEVTLHPPTPPSLSVEEGLGGVSGPLTPPNPSSTESDGGVGGCSVTSSSAPATGDAG